MLAKVLWFDVVVLSSVKPEVLGVNGLTFSENMRP